LIVVGDLLVFEKRLDDALAHDGQGLSTAIEGVADRRADPAFRDAIFLDIGVLDTVQPNSNRACENGFVVVTAARIDAESIRQSGSR
jgi:hypothetical protein